VHIFDWEPRSGETLGRESRSKRLQCQGADRIPSDQHHILTSAGHEVLGPLDKERLPACQLFFAEFAAARSAPCLQPVK
jgi:hypothetical protein